ncbi:MAG: glycoside hydrolase 43 family protein [Bacteroidetes bacterium]|nr:glycoside hydrolase 43 family protein [Candidatus Colenecus caballi]
MKTKLLFAACAVAALTLSTGCSAKGKTTECVNPLTYTDIPDNDWIRVGNDYYMVSTTMYFCPGAPIMHSKDLVHWEIISYVYDVLNDDDVYNLRNGRNAYGKGQWATSLRYVDGTFYALFIANDQGKTYIYRTDDIYRSNWERSVIDRPFHDASMLFEDGHLYVVWGNGELRIIELEPDGSAIKAGAQEKILIDSPRQGFNLRAEGAHIYHIGDYYYILEIDWPSGGVRTETCWRSKELMGEYERKVILSAPFDGRGDCVAQGGIIETRTVTGMP